MKKIFVLGSLNYDLVINCDRAPKRGETINGYGFLTNAGGKGANQAAAAAKAGSETVMIGCVGKDAFGEQLVASLASFGADTSKITAVDGSSGVAVITVAGGDNSIILDAGANYKITTPMIDDALSAAKAGDYLVLQFEIAEEIVLYALKKAKEKGMVTVVNPAPARKVDGQIIPLTDYFVPNETELFGLTGIDSDIEKGAQFLLDAGVKHVIVTVGSAGAISFEKGKAPVSSPAFKVKAVDTTAAGDTFIGYMVTGLAEGKDIASAMRLANAASSRTVMSKGAQMSIPYRDAVQKILHGNEER